jgi:hypothetical protein
MTSTTALSDADWSSLHTRRKVVEIRKDVREAKVERCTPLAFLDDPERSGREYDGEVEVARTEPCSPALTARVMAAARHGGTTWMLEGWNPDHEQGPPQMQNGLYWDLSSIPREPRLPYPLMSSIWPTPPPQGQPEAIPARVRAIEGPLHHSTRPLSPVPHSARRRPRSLQPFHSPSSRSPPLVTHSTPPTGHTPHSVVPTTVTPPQPSTPAGSISWTPYPAAPLTEQTASNYLGSSIQLFQVPSQHGYFVHFPDSSRTSPLGTAPYIVSFLIHVLRVPSATTYGVHRGTHIPSIDTRCWSSANRSTSPS